jgi:hypothetical protein
MTVSGRTTGQKDRVEWFLRMEIATKEDELLVGSRIEECINI